MNTSLWRFLFRFLPAGVGTSWGLSVGAACCAAAVLLSNVCNGASAEQIAPFEVRVEAEETVCHPPAYEVTNNGSGMFWGFGNTQLVRVGGRLFVSAFEHVPGAAPLNNARWALYERGEQGWHLCQRDLKERTREPSPLGVSHAGRLLMSVNPTVAPLIPEGQRAVGGPARPEFLEFLPDHPEKEPKHLLPPWTGAPKFTEHSYRTFAADGASGEFILFQNIGSTHSQWALLDQGGRWKTGQLVWPEGEDTRYSPYHDLRARVNYPNVILSRRAVHFLGHAPLNIWNRIDPLKSETYGRERWGSRMRKLYYVWTPDVTTTPFSQWTVLDDTMDDGGVLWMGDSWLAPDGRVHVVWRKEPIHPKLRDTYFPDIKRDCRLCYGILKDGKVLEKRVLLSGGETTGPLRPLGQARFHVTPDHTLYLLCYLVGTTPETRAQTGNYAMRLETGGSWSAPVRIPWERPVSGTFLTATPRSGNPPSEAADLLIADTSDGKPVVRYSRLRFVPACASNAHDR